MLDNCIERLLDNIFRFITSKAPKERGLLIKKHTENLQTFGEFSFPNTLKSWHTHMYNESSNDSDITLMKYIGKGASNLTEESKQWCLRIGKVKEENDRVYIFLDRPMAIRVGLSEALNNISVIAELMSKVIETIHIDASEDSNCITSLRAKYLSNTIKNLCAISATEDILPQLLVSSKSSSKSSNNKMILCGAVLNSKTGVKETNLSAEDFIRLRQNEMTLIAQHKYGVRVSTDNKWKEFIAHLGESAVVFELLQTKPSSALKINFSCSSAGSSKGAAFILYNCARLETLVRTYNDKVNEGLYPPLPDSVDVDLSLLSHEEEWCLTFNYILGLPSLLRNCFEVKDHNCEFRPHLICSFLCSMVRVFSQYYRKTRILTEPRKHLLPVVFARIHMLQVLNQTLKICLKILNIKSVSQMYLCFYFRYK